MVVVNHRLSTRLLQHLNPFNELLEFAINRFIKGHKGDGTPPGHQRNDEWMSFWKNRKHFIHFVEKLKNFEKNLEQNWYIWKNLLKKSLLWALFFTAYFFFYLQLTLLQIREKCISKVLDYKLVQQWSLQKNPMIDCLQWKGVNQQSFQKCTFENEMILVVSDKRTLIGQVCYWNHFLRQWSEIPLESEFSN